MLFEISSEQSLSKNKDSKKYRGKKSLTWWLVLCLLLSMHSLSLTLRQPLIDRLGLPCFLSPCLTG